MAAAVQILENIVDVRCHASIIETLLSRGYVERNRRQLLPTAQGRALLSVLPVPALRSPGLTGSWEARLVAMSEGEESRDAFMEDIRRFTSPWETKQ